MKNLHTTLAAAALAVACGWIVSACNAVESGGLRSGYGLLELHLTDAPAPQVKEIVVSVDKVTAHLAGQGWLTVTQEDFSVDLLTLQNGKTMPLGSVMIPAGKITQLRLYLRPGAPQYVTLPSGAQVPLKVPSGVQSGIKIKGPFELGSCDKLSVTLDFDGKKSIWTHPTGQGDEWILRPVIHAKRSVSTPVGCTDPGDPGEVPGGGSGSGGGGGEIPGGGGAPCTDSSQCLSEICSNGTCGQSGPGGACQIATDCTTSACTAEGTCDPGGAGAPGDLCQLHSDCLSGTCLNGVCDPGTQGTPCQVDGDCASGFTCLAQSCQPTIN